MIDLLKQVQENLEQTGDINKEFWWHIIKTQEVLGDVSDHFLENPEFKGDVQMAQKSLDVILSGMVMLARTSIEPEVLENMFPQKLKHWRDKAK